MHRTLPTLSIFSLMIGAAACACLTLSSRILAQQSPAAPRYIGFDLNTYPGDDALPVLRKTFSFAGYWLSPPPGAKQNNWSGKRQHLLAQKFGFLLLYSGPQIAELKSLSGAAKRGAKDAANAAGAAEREGFPSHAIIFLDIEEGGRLPENYHAYLRAWDDELARAAFRAGVYCSGMPVSEGHGVTIITADDIRNHIAKRDLAYFIYNDACPPSPGCVLPHNPPPPSRSGVAYAAVWQFAQSPRRKQFAARCAATYNPDGNCYAPGDTAHAWFLDLNSATTSDPSSGRGEGP
jgi:Rv2525c-like, glycoside hydrolase-like domain